MARLIVTRPDTDEPEEVEVTRRRPVTIGSHSISNVVVDGVAALSCRVSWNGSQYEAVAAGEDDVIVNGKTVRRRPLEQGDELTFGDVTLTLKRGRGKKRREVANVPAEDESIEQADALPPEREPPEQAEDTFDDDIEELAGADEEQTVDVGTKSKIRARLRDRDRRPGERDALRSPLIYGMAAGVVLLVVATLALTLFLRGQSIEQQFQEALAAKDAGRYSDASRNFAKFIKANKGHSLVPKAKRWLAMTNVDQKIRGAAPDWPDGLKQLESTISTFRDDDDFSTVHTEVAERAGLIALGAASDAGRKRDASLVPLSERAEGLLTKYSPDAVPPETLLDKIMTARDASRNRLVQLKVLDEYVARMTTSAANGNSLDVLAAAGQLREADASLADERAVRTFVKDATAEIKARVRPLDPASLSQGEADETRLNQMAQWTTHTIAVVDRPVGEARPSGEPLCVFADETYFACDRASGDPLWSQPLPGSFRPVPVEIPERGAIGYDNVRHALVLLRKTDGEIIRTIPLPASSSSPERPRVFGATAFVPLDSRLLRIDLDNARVTAAVEFGQPILAEPALLRVGDRDALLVTGAAQTVYLVRPMSLDLIDMFVLGHPTGTVLAPISAAAEFGVVAVNRPARNASDVILLTATGDEVDDLKLRRVSSARVDGLVVDPPALRGRDLFVSSTGERVTVLTLSDEEGGQVTLGPAFATGRASDAPVSTYLVAAADREFWMASRRLRRLRATAEAIRPIGSTLPLRRPVEPPRVLGGDVYTVAKRSTGSTVTFSRVEAETMRERWQVQLASDVVAFVPSDQPQSLFGVTEHGDVVRGTVRSERFVTSPTGDVPGQVQSTCEVGPQLAVASGTHLSWIGTTGRVVKQVELESPATAPIVAWDDRVVVPIAGKLVVYKDGRPTGIPAFWLPKRGDQTPAWRSVLVLDNMHLLAIDDSNTLRAITLVAGNQPHLAETATAVLDGVVDVVASSTQIVVATQRDLHTLDSGTLGELSVTAVSDDVVITELTGEVDDLCVFGKTKDGGVLFLQVKNDAKVLLPSSPVGLVQRGPGTFLLTLEDRLLNLQATDDSWKVTTMALPSPAGGAAKQIRGTTVVPLANGSVAIRNAE